MTQSITSQNNLIDVATYADRATPFLANTNPWLGASNSKYNGISGIPGQLGATALIKLPIQTTVTRSLKFNTQGWNQQYKSISVDKQYSDSMAVSTSQYIFNVEEFLNDTARPMISNIGTTIGSDASQLAISNTYRFFGSTSIPFSSQNDLGRAVAAFRNYGAAPMGTKGFLYDNTVAEIIAGQSNAFTPNLNDEYVNSWELGKFAQTDWMSTNIMATHLAGTEGNAGTTLTVVSTTVDADNRVTAITFSGTDSPMDANSIKKWDKLYFIPVAGKTTPYYKVYNGDVVSGNVVQMRAEADAESTAGSQVTVNIYPPLSASNGAYPSNINTPIVPGMQVKVLADHKAGLLYSGDALYVAVPPLPDQDPFDSKVSTDPDSGLSLMFSRGWMLGQAEFIFGYSCVAGYTLVDQMAMCLVQPV